MSALVWAHLKQCQKPVLNHTIVSPVVPQMTFNLRLIANDYRKCYHSLRQLSPQLMPPERQWVGHLSASLWSRLLVPSRQHRPYHQLVRHLNTGLSPQLLAARQHRHHHQQWVRHLNGSQVRRLTSRSRNKDVMIYATAFVLAVLGGTYAAVPLYRIYCQSTGKGGKAFVDEKKNRKIMDMTAKEERLIRVTFSAETTSQMAWNFRPTQPEIRCFPGETVLAFFTARNPLDRPVDGIATYSVQPYEAGTYLNKIQCFCFEEQRLNPHEVVDLPVFFYIDPEYADDPRLENVDDIVLSYTFFEAKKGLTLPSFMSSPTAPTPSAPTPPLLPTPPSPTQAVQKL